MDLIIEKLCRYFGSWSFAVLDERRGLWMVAASVHSLPYLRSQNAQGRHILLKPSEDREPFYLLADDLNGSDLDRDHRQGKFYKPGRFIVETSPGNYQVWIRSDRPLENNEKRYWLNLLGSDPACGPDNRWGRSPGFRNRKEKYAHARQYPLAKLIWIDWKRSATIPLSKTVPGSEIDSFPSTPLGVCVTHLSRDSYERCNESATDFAYILALLRRGVPRHQIRQRLLDERIDWKHHSSTKRREAYLERSLSRAESIIQRSS